MRYISEINAFMDLQAINRLSAGQQALWFALMHIANRCGWQEWLSVPNSTLQLYTGLSRNGVEKARNVLKQKGYIDFVSRGTKATTYKLISHCSEDSIQDSVQSGVQDSIQDSVQDSMPYIRQDKIRQDTIKENKQKKFKPPTAEVVEAYCQERENGISGQAFVDFYASKGWKIGKEPMKDWKAAVRTWEQRRKPEQKGVKRLKFQNFSESREYDIDDLEEKMLKRRGLG